MGTSRAPGRIRSSSKSTSQQSPNRRVTVTCHFERGPRGTPDNSPAFQRRVSAQKRNRVPEGRLNPHFAEAAARQRTENLIAPDGVECPIPPRKPRKDGTPAPRNLPELVADSIDGQPPTVEASGQLNH